MERKQRVEFAEAIASRLTIEDSDMSPVVGNSRRCCEGAPCWRDLQKSFFRRRDVAIENDA